MSFYDNNYSSPPGRSSGFARAQGPKNSSAYALDSIGPSQTLANSITEEIKQLSSNVGQIEQLVRSVGTSKDNQALRDKLDSLLSSTRELTKTTTENIKVLDSYKGTDKRMLQQKLTKDFQTCVTRFQEVYKTANEKIRNTPVPQSKQPSRNSQTRYDFQNEDYGYSDPRDEEKQGLMASHNREQQQQQHQFLQSEIDFQNSIISERSEGIKEIEKTVVEVNEIFRDLSTLVAEQGSMIDSIESNIESATVETSKGTEELGQASKHQQKSRTKLCCILLLVVIILAAVVFAIWFFALRK